MRLIFLPLDVSMPFPQMRLCLSGFLPLGHGEGFLAFVACYATVGKNAAGPILPVPAMRAGKALHDLCKSRSVENHV